MANIEAQAPQKTSFLGSTWSGVKGFAGGAITIGLVGIVAGAAVAAGVSAFVPADKIVNFLFSYDTLANVAKTVGTSIGPEGLVTGATGWLGAGVAAIAGAITGGLAFASVGGMAGAVSGVVRSREANQPTAEDVVNVAKISFAQGVAVGHQMEQSTHLAHMHKKNFVKSLETERTATINMPERQIMN